MSTKGFAGYSPAQRQMVSAKGGRAKVTKGFGSLPKERRVELARKGGVRKHELTNKRKEQDGSKEEEDSLSSRN